MKKSRTMGVLDKKITIGECIGYILLMAALFFIIMLIHDVFFTKEYRVVKKNEEITTSEYCYQTEKELRCLIDTPVKTYWRSK